MNTTRRSFLASIPILSAFLCVKPSSPKKEVPILKITTQSIAGSIVSMRLEGPIITGQIVELCAHGKVRAAGRGLVIGVAVRNGREGDTIPVALTV